MVNLASRLLSTFRGLGGLARASYGELCAFNGVSEAKASQLLAAMELGRRAVVPLPGGAPRDRLAARRVRSRRG